MLPSYSGREYSHKLNLIAALDETGGYHFVGAQEVLGDEHGVEEEHGEAKAFRHAPFVELDGHDHGYQHQEQDLQIAEEIKGIGTGQRGKKRNA